jgi:hypothetical protein
VKLRKIFPALFRKSPLFRTLTFFCCVFFFLGIASLISMQLRKDPVINQLNPPIGSPGDIMVLTGNNFGVSRNSSYVEIGGSRLTASGYLSWSNTEIKVVIPSNVQDGLVIVGTLVGRSKPAFFANETAIPVAVPPDTRTALPVIASVTPANGAYGTMVVISGSNFGSIRNNSAVYFSANRDDSNGSTSAFPGSQQANIPGNMNTEVLAANAGNFDYEYWSDTEIHVRIPDGAATGPLSVQTEKGASNTQQISITSNVGKRQYTERRTFLIQLAADVVNAGSKNDAVLTIRVPRPSTTPQQPMAEVTDTAPDPVIPNFQQTIVYQVALGRSGSKKIRFNQDFVIAVYTLQTAVDEQQVKPFNEKSRLLYSVNTAPDQLVSSGDQAVQQLAKTIIGRESNPYRQAKLIYSYMLDNYILLQQNRKGSDSPLDLIESKHGDAYDFALLYTALVRAAGIPAVPVSGILIDADLKTRNHWWSEFYIENFGWIPVDPALGAGLEYRPFRMVSSIRDFYFGNLDSQHISFSRGWNEIKQSAANSRYVYRPRTYAFQSIWEETSSKNVNYSSLWNTPTVIGVY